MAAEQGADLSAPMLAAGLDPAAQKHPEMLLDYRGFCDLLQGCAIKWDMPDIGIRMATFQAIDFLGPVGWSRGWSARSAVHCMRSSPIW